ncbi:MAG TPA: MBL fold metallo-hydrolase [Burkholderiaceae bacterium]|nr:GAF domain-containing protein [Rhodoferax sp.]HQX60783.1 MBL fold metallo-hydrolase [Burkholderiaceae bacterium]HQZ05324.1 MBL fold metallo-hydrolase [Burkholderiaceae bacterium]
MRVQFWGTRGSIATPGPETVRYGGNTSCVSIRTRRGTQLVIDAGTGLRALGIALMTEGEEGRRGHLLIGHTHWDHIQGFPFFAPLFEAGHEWDVYAPRGFGPSLRETLAGQMQYTYFPVNLDEMGATIRYHDLVEGSFMIDEVRVTARYLNHPALTLGYRLEVDGITVVYASDHEGHAHAAALGMPLGQVLGALHPGDNRHREFIAKADLLIHDAQYTAAEYPKRIGWGHSTIEYVVDMAIAAGVRQLALYHHDPSRTDEALDALVVAGRQRVRDAGASVNLFGAAEGMVLELDAPDTAVAPARGDAQASIDTQDLADKQVLIACTDAALAEEIREVVRSEGLSAVIADTPQDALLAIHPQQLALAVIEHQFGDTSGLSLLRALRALEGLAQLPVIMLAPAEACAQEESKPLVAASAAPAVTEWLCPPFTPQYLRTKLRAGLLRTRARWQAPPIPQQEMRRLAALHALEILDTPAEERFDRITRLAARFFGVPIALISLVDRDRQWFKSRSGSLVQQTSREVSFCGHAILQSDVMVVADALADDRFADNPLVQSEPRLRFYAGHPIVAADGSAIGTLCLIDHKPRHFGAAQIKALRDMAALVERELQATAVSR